MVCSLPPDASPATLRPLLAAPDFPRSTAGILPMSLPTARLRPTLTRLAVAVVVLCVFGLLAPGVAQVPRDFAVDLQATVAAAPPYLTLSWTASSLGTVTSQRVHRRLKGATTWVLQATLGTTDTSYADPTAAPGVEYEYWMQRQHSGFPSTAMGYLSAGANLPFIEDRGTLLLVIEDSLPSALAPEIAQLKDDLAGDGWTVQTIPVARDDTPPNVRALIQAAYTADPVNVKAVYVFGHVPVPYSGQLAPDGHGDHVGAWPADGYYGDMDGIWTDATVTTTGGSPARTENVPGDGKFDQSALPSDLELQVGRVDLNAMTQAPASSVSELVLLRRYLRKAHDYRHRLGAYANVPRRSMIRDGFGFFGGECFATSGWAAAYGCVSRTVDQPATGQWYNQATANTYLFGHGDGGGSFTSASGVGTTAEFGRSPSRVVFTEIFGSYHGDWDATNNFMRSVLAGMVNLENAVTSRFDAGHPRNRGVLQPRFPCRAIHRTPPSCKSAGAPLVLQAPRRRCGCCGCGCAGCCSCRVSGHFCHHDLCGELLAS